MRNLMPLTGEEILLDIPGYQGTAIVLGGSLWRHLMAVMPIPQFEWVTG
jgi:hypothetical protein